MFPLALPAYPPPPFSIDLPTNTPSLLSSLNPHRSLSIASFLTSRLPPTRPFPSIDNINDTYMSLSTDSAALTLHPADQFNKFPLSPKPLSPPTIYRKLNFPLYLSSES